ncbi:beta-microseminoprotein [Megaptera novaeangliae]
MRGAAEGGRIIILSENALLGSLVVLATFATLCNAQCYIVSNQNSTPNKCKDLNGVIHPLNSKWKTENCEECYVSLKPGTVTDSDAAVPVDYDTNKCQIIFNKETCTYTVVEQEDPGKTCAVSGWVL